MRHVRAGEEQRLREVRLAALAADPGAYGSTLAGQAARPRVWWAQWAAASASGADERTFVAEDADGRWHALALVRRGHRDGTGEMHAVWVAPAVRGRGVLRDLCAACAAWAGSRGLDVLELGVLEDNAAARAAYRAVGFADADRFSVVRDGRELRHVRMTRQL